MKKRALSLILAAVLTLLSIPVASSAADDTSPVLYTDLSFDDQELGSSATDYGVLTLSHAPTVTARGTSLDRALRLEQAKGSVERVQATVFPFRAIGVADLAEHGEALVISYDLYISADNGGTLTLFQTRGENKWGTPITATTGNGAYTVGTEELSYGTWNRFDVVLHPAKEGETVATADLYINGKCAVKNFPTRADGQSNAEITRFHIGEFYNAAGAERDCFLMVDNLRVYSGEIPCTDKELGLGSAVFCGLQVSDKIDTTFQMRMIAAVDSTAYHAIGFDIQATYTKNGTPITKKAEGKNITTVYTSILANTEAGLSAYTAEELGGGYLGVMTLSGIPVDVGEIVFTASVWVKENGKNSPVKRITSKLMITYHGMDPNGSANITAQRAACNETVGFEEIALQINNRYNGARKTLSTLETKTLYSPTDSWFYSHHQMIGCINGTLVAVWSQGRWNEGDLGQRIAYAISTDFVTWSKPKILIDSMQGLDSEMVLSVQGIYNNGECLIVYFGANEYKPETLRDDGNGGLVRPIEDGNYRDDSGFLGYITTEDGVHWSEYQTMERRGGAGNGPTLMENGELFFCPGGLWGCYTNDTTGITWTGAGTGNVRIDRETALEKGAKWFGETSFYFRDGIMYLLGRTYTPYLWIQFSENYGRTWSEPYKTEFTDSNSKFVFGRLPDGRYYYVGNPEPNSNRLPLVLAISEDGLNFDEQYILGDTPYTMKDEGLHKSGHYGYPNCYVGEDGYFYVIYSRGKESIEVCRFALSEIGITE